MRVRACVCVSVVVLNRRVIAKQAGGKINGGVGGRRSLNTSSKKQSSLEAFIKEKEGDGLVI